MAANNAETIQCITTQSNCQKILLSIRKEKCKTIEEVESFVEGMLSDTEEIMRKKGLSGAWDKECE